MELWQMKIAEAIITVTPQLKEMVVSMLGSENVYVIPNGANTEVFSPTARISSPISQPYVVFFGAMAPWQGIDTILAAADNPSWPSEVGVVFIGEGTEADAVRRAARVNSRIKYMGVLPYRSVPSFVANSIAGLSVQSNVEGRAETGLYPLKVFETMACGRPVIVSDWPGQSDLVRSSSCGVVVAPDDPSKLAEAVAYLASNPFIASVLGSNGRKEVEERHSWKARAYQTHQVISSVIGLDLEHP